MQAYTSPRRTFGFFGGSRLIIWCLGVVVVAAIILTGFFYNRHEIRIHADGKEVTLVMRGGTVSDALKKAHILIGEKDIVQPKLSTELQQNVRITITRMIPFTLVADGKEVEYLTTPGKIGQAFKKLNISLNSGDEVVPALEEQLSPNDTVQIIRYSSKYIDQPIKVSYKVERKNDKAMERGNTKVVREGKDGLIQRTIKITLKDGKEIKREVVGEKIVREPQNKIVAVGTMRTTVVSRGDSIKYSRSLRMSSSAYSHTGNRTASGVYPSRGVAAVDPSVIPLGTRLYIEGYGYARAMDIGSSIRGNRIDLFFETERQALKWGRRSVKVYILN